MTRHPKSTLPSVHESSVAGRRGVAIGLVLIGIVAALVVARDDAAESTASGDARPPSDPPPRRSAAPGWASIIEASSDEALQDDDRTGRPLALVLDGGVAPTRAATVLLPSEQSGRLAESYARWSVEPEDVGISSDVTSYLGRMLADFGIHPRAATVSCTPSICRTEVVFDSAEQMASAASIPAEGARLRLATAMNEGAPRAVVYWDRSTDELPF